MPFASGELVIRKRDIWPNENVIVQMHSIPKLNAVLDGYSIANRCVVFYKNLRTDIAIAANTRIGQDDNKLPDGCSLPYLLGLDIGGGVDFDFQVVVLYREFLQRTHDMKRRF